MSLRSLSLGEQAGGIVAMNKEGGAKLVEMELVGKGRES